MFGLFIFIFRGDLAVPQRDINIAIDITNKVNVCLPEDENTLKKSFFDF